MPEGSDLLVSFEPIDDPVPHTSFGSIGRFVNVQCGPMARFTQPRITITYESKDLGWVDPRTLRLFEVDVERREYTLVPRSIADPERGEVNGFVERSGVYGLVGLPTDSTLLRLIRAISELTPEILEEQARGQRGLMEDLCDRILCAPPGEARAGRGFAPPGPGGWGDPCEFCLGLRLSDGGLPEAQLLSHVRGFTEVEPPAAQAGPYLYALLGTDGADETVIEVVDLSTMSFVQTVSLGTLSSPAGMVMTPHGPCVLEYDTGSLHVYDEQVARWTLTPGGSPAGCTTSADGSTLYASFRDKVVVVDLSTGNVRTVSLPLTWLHSLAVSPDGRTLVVLDMMSRPWPGRSLIHLIDTATLGVRSVPIADYQRSPYFGTTWSDGIGFVDSRLVILWDSGNDRMYQADLGTGTQLPPVMDLPWDHMGSRAVTVPYVPALNRAYAIRGIDGPSPWTGDLVVVDVGPFTGTVRARFTGAPRRILLDPRDGRTMYIGLTWPLGLDAYDARTDHHSAGVYAFTNVDVPGTFTPYSLADMAVSAKLWPA